MAKIKIFVADDHPVVREGLRSLFDKYEEMKLVGEAGDGRETIDGVRKTKPDVVVLDIAMPMMSGLDCIPLIKSFAPEINIVMLTMFSREAYVHQALASGVHGYVLKTAPLAEVVEAVRMAAVGKYFLSKDINSELIRSYLANDERMASESGRYDLLSDREQQVFRMVIEGNPTKEIADMLCLSPKTVEKHRSNISKKLGIIEPLAMLKFAIKIGVADPELWPDPYV
ncbi:MAG: response regulator transcription factor [Desulfobulbaceae bacterium]|nr:response regulator transcription factor [Desulfobulbaceae bacterium]HIJ79849.1 response regulator transcription factor [Deltaproteobacteria bacterium]